MPFRKTGNYIRFGVKLWVIVQNVGQLKQHYEKAWETFIEPHGEPVEP
jgi:type IV secretory pathway TraG/TraD family ATPase VirD4